MKLPNLKVTRNLSDKVYDYLEEQILSGALDVGARLPTEPELSQGFGVSRTVIREAIQKLKAQGLVVSKVGSGSYVASDPTAQIKKVFSHFSQIYANKRIILDYVRLRTVVEIECISFVARQQDPVCLAALEAIVEKMGDPKTSRLEDFNNLDIEFHLVMADATGNIMFQAILEPLKDFGSKSGLFDKQRNVFEQRREPIRQEHRLLLDLIKAGDVEKATAFFRERMRHTLEYIGE